MFDTSKDIFFFVIAFCALWLTIFLCWMFYYTIRILRNANQIIEEFRVRLQALSDVINKIHGKVENLQNVFSLITGGVGGLVKKVVAKKTNEWVDKSTNQFNAAAKDAVDKAVVATAAKMKKMTKRVKK